MKTVRATQFALLAVLVIVVAGFALLADYLLTDVERETYQATEEVLVDMANVLATIVEDGLRDHQLNADVLRDAWPRALNRRFDAAIFDLNKTQVNAQVYLTDDKGLVVYDSEHPDALGQDLSGYRDVSLTLKGQYGARSSRYVANDSKTSTLHVAAPVRDGDRIIGVLTVRKPKMDQWLFVQQRRAKVQVSTLLIGSGILLFVGAVMFWVLQPMRRLTAWVQAIKRGERPPMPPLRDSAEVNTLGSALAEMRQQLEGRDYAATFVQTLTHELKSPLAAIRATSELLAENTMDEAQRRRFADSLRIECERTEHLIRQLLRLAEVERQETLQTRRAVDFKQVVLQAVVELQSMAETKNVRLEPTMPPGPCEITGDETLLRRAVMNLIENALDFSPAGGQVEVRLEEINNTVQLTIADRGPGIPDYALPRLFERFYSLKHSQTGRKGSGLGLCFAKETAHLHGGSLTLINREGGGAQAIMTLATAPLE